MVCKPFQLPIESNEMVVSTAESIVDELEFAEPQGAYAALMPSSEGLGLRTRYAWSKFYTTDKSFLRSMAHFISRSHGGLPEGASEASDVLDAVNAMRAVDEKGHSFLTRYQYIEWEQVAALNRNPHLLQWLCMYNMSSPIFALVLPILLLFLPLIVMRLRGYTITVSSYASTLKQTFKRHPLGHFIGLGASDASVEKKVTASLSIAFYGLQVYQNIRACVQFYRNMKEISRKLDRVKIWLGPCIEAMLNMEADAESLSNAEGFAVSLRQNRLVLQDYMSCLKSFRPLTGSIRRTKDIGHAMRCFYLLNRDDDTIASLNYALDFTGFLENLNDLRDAYQSKRLRKVRWLDSESGASLKSATLPNIDNAVPNTVPLDTSVLVTGPNAAGKTTLLKTTLFNVLLGQQCGLAHCKRAALPVFHAIHCYLNIPDTGGRDSLFQAEARRCKDILDTCRAVKGKDTFCIFDELFSGTNPYEAVAGGTAYLEHLAAECPRLKVMVTTHYLDMCSNLSKHASFTNMHMCPAQDQSTGLYPYRLRPEACSWKGGVKALEELGYPQQLTDRAKEIIAAS